MSGEDQYCESHCQRDYEVADEQSHYHTDEEGEAVQRDAELRAQESELPVVVLPTPGAGGASLDKTLPSTSELRDAAKRIIEQVDIHTTSPKSFRAILAEHFGLGLDALEPRKETLADVFKEVVEDYLSKKACCPQAAPDEDEDLGIEDGSKSRRAYLVTVSHTDRKLSDDGYKLVPPGAYSRSQICAFLLGALAATQANREAPMAFTSMVVFLERHVSKHIHYHIAIVADRCFRFGPLKKELLTRHGLATHWSCTHDGYASCVAYGYLPSLKKPVEELDPEPLTWALAGKTHPPLLEASRAPITSRCWAKRREHGRKCQAARGKTEARFRDIDLWPVVIQQNIVPDEVAAERVMAYAKRCGGPAMMDYCFQNWDKLPMVVARSWKVEKVEEYVDKQNKTRLDILRDAQSSPCACDGQWMSAARRILKQNGLNEDEWRRAVLTALVDGRCKGNLICHAGLEGNEGKSFLLKPLLLIFGEEGVFVAPPKSAFPLIGLEKARLALLDDWRFNEDIVPYAVQLLWFEGAPFVIARPQNVYTGHLRYSKEDPVFLTTLLEDLTSLKGKRFLKKGDVDMMLKRLLVFKFTKKISIPKTVAAGCPCCFAKFLLAPPPVEGTTGLVGPAPADPAGAGSKRKILDSAGQSPDRKKADRWSVNDVLAYMQHLGLGHVGPVFEENGVDGQMLCELTELDLVNNLGLKPLQARKVVQRLWA